MDEQNPKILLIEDSDLLLEGLSFFIESKSDFKVVGKLKDIADVFDFLKRNKVNIVLSDIMTMNNHNAIDYVPKIKKDFPGIKVILMTSVMEVTFIKRAKEAGADSFVYKNIPTEELITILKDTAKNYSIYPNEKVNDVEQFKKLTDIEMTIVRLACQGLDNKEIADKAGYSKKTIRNYVSGILEKTGFPSMSKLCIWATKNGYIV